MGLLAFFLFLGTGTEAVIGNFVLLFFPLILCQKMSKEQIPNKNILVEYQ